MTLNVKSPNVDRRVSKFVDSFVAEGVSRLQKFHNSALIKHKLVPSSFFFPFKFTKDTSVDIADFRKTVAKLRMLFLKHINKIVPSTLFSTTPVLEVVNKQDLSFKISVPQFTIDLSKIPDSLGSNGVKLESQLNTRKAADIYQSTRYQRMLRDHILRESPLKIHSIQRYIRYLNYLCKKYCLGINLDIDSSIFSLKSWDSVGNAGMNSTLVNVETIEIYIRFMPCIWVLGDGILEQQVRSNDPAVVELLGAASTDVIFTESFRTPEGSPWHPLEIGRNTIGTSNSNIDCIFLYLPQILKVLTTLTRKAQYGIGAYTIGQAE